MIGKTLVHYEITAQIGKGGMGEVYQAKDTKLGRDVAIKVLPEEFAMDHDRVARFQREAKLLASLNHPNIAAIYGLEESEGIHFLVMELIEGDTLRDRIKAGPIPVEEALKLALQVAEGLEAAHENGVIHRDLKPANIKVTPDGKVKVLDFGLAKAFVGDQENVKPEDSPTISAVPTQQGVILGTAAYMSPEQARGKPVDKRADIWAFGIVLFEMLTGKSLFSGEDVTSTVARVLEREPDFSTLPQNLHPRIQFMLERCLKKVPKDRYSGISDARVDIQSVLADPSGIFTQPIGIEEPRRNLRVILASIAAAVILTALIVGAAIWTLKPAPPSEPKRVMRSEYVLPEDQQLYQPYEKSLHLAVSPDGSQFAYSTTKGIYIRSMSELDARLISGTNEDASSLFFSPDGQWIGYFSMTDQKLKSISVSGGTPTNLCDAAVVLGAYWYEDNTIVYSDFFNGVYRIPAKGGTPEVLVERPGVADGQLLPDGQSVMFIDATGQTPFKTMVQSLDTGEQKVVLESGYGFYYPTGHLLYSTGNNMFAVRFDLDKLELTGGAVSLMETPLGSELSKSGTLVYVPPTADTGGSSVSPKRTLVWVDHHGKETPLKVDPGDYRDFKISPDGKGVALTVNKESNVDIWVLDLVRNNMRRLTFHVGDDNNPLWTPDSQRILYQRADTVRSNIYSKAANGTGEEEKLVSSSGRMLGPSSWSSEGKTLVLVELAFNPFSTDIGVVAMEGENLRNPLLADKKYMEAGPQVSPDGRMLAYQSDESGKVQVYVCSFPQVDKGKWQVSLDGGISPRWSPDGRKLYYKRENAVIAVDVETEPVFNPGNEEILFEGNYLTFDPNTSVRRAPWDIHPNGNKFLMMKEQGRMGDESTAEESEQAGPRKINIVVNWDEELKQRVPVD